MASGLVRTVARGVVPWITKWRAFWNTEGASAAFRSPAEQAEYLEALAARNASLKKSMIKTFAKENIFPRVTFGEDLVPRLQRLQSSTGLCV